MHYTKLRISEDGTSRLRALRTRTGLTPNLLCRFALMLSLEEGPVGEPDAPDDDGQEFNAYTLTGEHTPMFAALLRFVEEPAAAEALTNEQLLSRLRAHIHRGLGRLAVRAKSPLDVARLAHVD